MICCEILVPVLSGRTRAPWHANKVPDWEEAAAYLFGGLTPSGAVTTGLWRDPDEPPHSPLVRDPLYRYEIAVEDNQVQLLRQFALFTCAHFEQKCLYFKVGTAPEFLPNPLGWQ